MFNEQSRQKTDKYEEKGVEDEEGLRKVIESGDEEEEEENKEEEDKDEDETDRPKRQGKKEKEAKKGRCCTSVTNWRGPAPSGILDWTTQVRRRRSVIWLVILEILWHKFY